MQIQKTEASFTVSNSNMKMDQRSKSWEDPKSKIIRKKDIAKN